MSSCISQGWLDAHPGARTVSKTDSHKGYADLPGTGPQGQTCGTCRHHVCKVMSKAYHKCLLMESIWTGGGATDIKVRSAACRFWSPRRGTALHAGSVANWWKDGSTPPDKKSATTFTQ